MKLKIASTAFFAVMLSACGGGSSSQLPGMTPDDDSQNSAGANDTGSPGGNGATGLSCRSPSTPVDQEHDVVLFDAIEYEAFEFMYEYEVTESELEEAAPGVFPVEATAYIALMWARVTPAFLRLDTVFCDYEQYAENQCQNTGLYITSASMSGEALSYTFTSTDVNGVFRESNIMISDPQYSSGSYRLTTSDGKVEDNAWSRDPDGTEHFSTTENDGSSSEFVEYPDCSGSASRVYVTSDGQPPSTTSASWTSPTGGSFEASFEVCDTREGEHVCNSFTR